MPAPSTPLSRGADQPPPRGAISLRKSGCAPMARWPRRGAAGMKRASAYGVVARELEQWRCLASDVLLEHVDAPPVIRVIEIASEPVSIEVLVSWRDESRTHLRVKVTANGPSTWRMERVVEHIDLAVAH
jgi:hypothetical protein